MSRCPNCGQDSEAAIATSGQSFYAGWVPGDRVRHLTYHRGGCEAVVSRLADGGVYIIFDGEKTEKFYDDDWDRIIRRQHPSGLLVKRTAPHL